MDSIYRRDIYRIRVYTGTYCDESGHQCLLYSGIPADEFAAGYAGWGIYIERIMLHSQDRWNNFDRQRVGDDFILIPIRQDAKSLRRHRNNRILPVYS